ncbi:hypothetical protein VOWphi5012_051 [Vibrio phage phi50-12]|uniref:Metallopeptidase domain protein n=1 Tax=Vibrio phage phi50-12 TaxID=2654972 RepID=A0A5P8PRF2_9CAUD|nr:HNH endonuclease [Vibrio phage phi50-12]QFR59835.1 hypothetical protein VOWphi5012_051 [Vibrio phage phi50-12]
MYKEFNECVDEIRMFLMTTKELSYFSQILLQCNVIADESIPTACIGGMELRINPVWFMNSHSDPKELQAHQIFVLFHEALHPAFMDQARRGNRDPRVWNDAIDYFNNAFIDKEINSVSYPSPYVYDGNPMQYLRDTRFDGMDKEQIYDILMDENEEQDNALAGDCGGQGDEPEDGDQDSSPSFSKSEAEQINDVQNAVQQAAIQATQKGCSESIPDSVQGAIDKLINPKLPWNKLLMKYMHDMNNKDDYSYMKPNAHYLAQGLYAPTLHSESLGAIGMAHDESCSVSDDDVRLYLGAIHAVWNQMKPSQLDIVGFTTNISSQFKFKAGESLDKINFRGHGGTNIFPVFEHFDKIQPEVLIIFTDMEFRYPTEKPNYPVIWICVGNERAEKPSFGTMIHVES